MKRILLSEPEKERLRNLDFERKETEREIQELTLSILESREINPSEITGLVAAKDFSSLMFESLADAKQKAANSK